MYSRGGLQIQMNVYLLGLVNRRLLRLTNREANHFVR